MKRASQRHLPVHVSQVGITALLDAVLVLLLAFVVAVPFLRRDKSEEVQVITVPVEVPAAAPGQTIELRIFQDQTIQLAGKPVTGERLLPDLKQLLAEHPDSGVLVRMPSNFAAGPLARLMEEMHRAGVRHTAVEVMDNSKR